MAGNIQLPSTATAVSLPARGENGFVEEPKRTPVALSSKSERSDEDTDAEATSPDKQAVTYLVDALNNMSRVVDRNLEFTVDDKSGRIIIRVTDGETGEVIREIPPEDVGQSSRDSLGQLVGLLFNGVS